MKKEMLGIILFVLIAGTVVAFEQPTFVGLQGRVTDSVGVPVNNGNLRATVSTSASCEQNIIYDYTYNAAVRGGLFSILLGNDSNLNLTYNQDYYICTYINGEIQRNLGGSNTTKFRGGQGIIGAGNLTNGTFTTGNYTFADNLTLGAWLFVKSDEDFLSRVLRAPIKYKDLVDRSANENISGAWNFSNPDTIIINTRASDITASEWVFISERNVTSFAGGTNLTLGNLSGKIYKVIYYIDGGTGIDIRVNNITSASYSSKGYQSGPGAIDDLLNQNQWRITTLTTRARVYGSFVLSLDDANSDIRIVTTGVQVNDYGQPERRISDGVVVTTATTISEMQIQSAATWNGTILLFKHRFI